MTIYVLLETSVGGPYHGDLYNLFLFTSKEDAIQDVKEVIENNDGWIKDEIMKDRWFNLDADTALTILEKWVHE